jgi:biotin carboxyl carrier protein
MKPAMYDVRIGERTHMVGIDGEGAITLDGRTVDADIRPVDSTSYSILIGGKSFLFRINSSGAGYAAQVDGNPVTVLVDTERKRLLRRFAKAAAHGPEQMTITAPMPALVVRIETEIGQEVSAGQGLIVLEAMKMENEIKAPRRGVVKQIHVTCGRAVEKGEILFTLE